MTEAPFAAASRIIFAISFLLYGQSATFTCGVAAATRTIPSIFMLTNKLLSSVTGGDTNYIHLHKFPLPKKEQGETVFILIRRFRPPSQVPVWAPLWGPPSVLRSAQGSAPV